MSIKAWIAAALAALGVALSAAPALAAQACDGGNPQVRQLPRWIGDLSRDVPLSLSYLAPVSEKDFSLKALQAARDGCDRGQVTAGGHTYRLFGHAGGRPDRLALPDGGGPIVYLTAFEDLTEAIAAEKDKRPRPAPVIRYGLVVADDKGARLLGIFDAIPADAQMLRAVRYVVENDIPPIVSRDAKGQIAVNMEVGGPAPSAAAPPAPPSSQGDLTPKPGTGPGEPSTSLEPQGPVWEKRADGGVLHRASGVVCPAALKGFRREQLTVYDAADGGRDVSCRFLGERSWMTLYMTRLPPRYDGRTVFDLYVKEALQAAPQQGGFIDGPLAAGPRPLPAYGRFWKDGEGRVQGLWLTQIGPWHIKLRLTMQPGDEQAVHDFAAALYEMIHAQVDAATT